MDVKNKELRGYIKEKNVKMWEIAEELGVADTTFCKWLRRELSEEMKKKIYEIVDRLSKGRKVVRIHESSN